MSKYAAADLFVPCGGRPKSVTAQTVKHLFQDGRPKFRFVIEGANLFLTDDARRALEDAGVFVYKDASTNKGGVMSSSLEVLAALVMPPADHELLMCVPEGSSEPPRFYQSYVQHIQHVIEERARLEFKCMWDLKQRQPDAYNTDTTDLVSTKINQLTQMIEQEFAGMDAELIENVLQRAMPPQFLERYGTEKIIATLPSNYLAATVARYLAAMYTYQFGCDATEYSFHQFLSDFRSAPPSTPATPLEREFGDFPSSLNSSMFSPTLSRRSTMLPMEMAGVMASNGSGGGK
eukprot:NODE_2960_length_1080_cov_7.699321_g2715_i0.p1 GENE.NODE_2960_length_1080_cov_7.699321_g2715_i0~~NODE_2960_length_1080_cov_7.699321_g2715_i0.p1  ORF type:complete len:338 (-),score=68.39 NODE_2960_length_1080_cov_7.699321_g2715_i0:66-938(-)